MTSTDTSISNSNSTVIEALASMTRRVESGDLADSSLYAAAMEYAKSYSGTFPFMVTMHTNVMVQGQWLSEGQAVAVLNCAVADYRYQQKANAVKVAESITNTPTSTFDHSKQYIADGWYTIVGPQGGHRTLRVETVEDGNVKQWLAYLCGTDNEGDYKSVGFIQGNEVTLFRKYTGQYADIVAAARFLVKNADKVGEYGKQYALRSGKCYRCNRKLTTPKSIADGIGPICITK